MPNCREPFEPFDQIAATWNALSDKTDQVTAHFPFSILRLWNFCGEFFKLKLYKVVHVKCTTSYMYIK